MKILLWTLTQNIRFLFSNIIVQIKYVQCNVNKSLRIIIMLGKRYKEKKSLVDIVNRYSYLLVQGIVKLFFYTNDISCFYKPHILFNFYGFYFFVFCGLLYYLYMSTLLVLASEGRH